MCVPILNDLGGWERTVDNGGDGGDLEVQKQFGSINLCGRSKVAEELDGFYHSVNRQRQAACPARTIPVKVSLDSLHISVA